MTPARSPSPRARQRAREVLAELQIASIGELDVELIAAHYGAVTTYRPLRNEQGHIIQRHMRAVITVAERWRDHPRAKWIVGHELGHFLLHDGIDQYRACTAGDLRDYRQSGREPEANRFAAELLMPELFFAPECDRNRPCLDDVRELAGSYGTSLMATARRLVEFSPERCAMAVSEGGRVLWARRSRTWRYYIPGGHRLTSTSFAGDLHASRAAPPRPQRVEARAWSSSEWIVDQDIYEHSMRLGSTGLVLTMLWEPTD